MAERNSKGHFKKGASGNPSGRKKGITTLVRELSHDYRDYIVMLDDWARDTKLSVKERRECIKEILNRSLGMPTQRNEISGVDIVVGLPDLTDSDDKWI